MWVDIAYLNAFEAKIGALKPPLHNVSFCNLFLGPKNDKRPFEIPGLYNGLPQTEVCVIYTFSLSFSSSFAFQTGKFTSSYICNSNDK